MLGQEIGEFLVWRLGEAGFLPQIRGQVRVGLGDGCRENEGIDGKREGEAEGAAGRNK